MTQYRNVLALPGIPALTEWTKDGSSDFYWPEPTEVLLWRNGQFQTDEEAATGDLPDHYHWHKLWVENMPLSFTVIL